MGRWLQQLKASLWAVIILVDRPPVGGSSSGLGVQPLGVKPGLFASFLPRSVAGQRSGAAGTPRQAVRTCASPFRRPERRDNTAPRQPEAGGALWLVPGLLRCG